MSPLPRELSADEVRRTCPVELFDFEHTGELAVADEIIGQPRATRAIDFGIDIASPGYNVYVLGPAGTGRTTTIQRFLERRAAKGPVPDDWCYVYNFDEPSRPRALRLPPGTAVRLRADMERLVDHLRLEIPRAFESEEYEKTRNQIAAELQKAQEEELSALGQKAGQLGFGLMRTASGLVPVPVVNGQPMTPQAYNALPAEERARLTDIRRQLEEELNDAGRRIREREREARQKAQELDRQVASFACGPLIDELQETYQDLPEVVDYLEAVRQDIIERVTDFLPRKEEEAAAQAGDVLAGAPGPRLTRYKVNVLVDRSGLKGAPVVVEPTPTYYNIVGRVEQKAHMGMMVTDFTLIKPGALHRANGGYLVLNIQDVLSESFTWEALKRALRNAEIRIEELGGQYRLFALSTLEPEPIPLQVKVILLGSPTLYYLLYGQDEDFRKLFKVRADFAVEMDRNEENISEYVQFIATRCAEEGLRHFDRSGVARVVEYGSRLVEDQNKLSTRFGDIADLIREASYWASRNGHELVTTEDVERAIQEKVYRANMVEERIQEHIRDGTILIDTTGEVVGQVNGLSVYNLGGYSFGRPSRITARTYAGKGGVVHIEREVKLSGPIHDKGVMILSGYLGGQYAQERPLSLSASLTFEQMYDEVDGDSASSAELYALLSSLSGLPLKQSIAVTGSVDQRGEVQAVGGVTYKVEGYFDVCRARGLTGDQGVIIPRQNVRNLMLRQDVVEAIREGKFHIYPVASVDEGLEILTGREAGVRGEDGTFPEGTVHFLVEQRLRKLAEAERPEEEQRRESEEAAKEEKSS
ncbi:MAG: AAA family ATPase [Anaerolineae bacterium]|nr:AAA family ATPase [Anaerolineae bacterium]